jgi:pilus assembly protein CpaC
MSLSLLRRASLALCAAALGALALGAPLSVHAQEPQGDDTWLDVEVGHSFIYRGDRPIGRVLTSDPEVASLKLLEQGQVQVLGRAVGTTDLWVWYLNDMQNPIQYELTVHTDLSDLIRRVDRVVDGAPPRVYPLDERIVVEGPVDSIESLERISEMARVYDEDFVNNMTVKGDHQIQLEVVFAEVNRTALREMGFNMSWGDSLGGVGMVGPNISAGTNVTRDALRPINNGITPAPAVANFNFLGHFGNPAQIAAVLSILEQNNISRTLARPTLTALSGQQAEFLAGGEVPIPVSQFGGRISLEFKEYGIKLVFVPTVLAGDVVDMRVYVEVSNIDSATGVRITGIEIPGFLARKTDSHLRIESGMTFAMAGLLSETVNSTIAKVPVLGDIPLVGSLFRYVSHESNETELMIFVTPRLVRPLAPGEVPTPPGMTENFNPTDAELFLLGQDHRTNSRTAEPTGPIGLAR